MTQQTEVTKQIESPKQRLRTLENQIRKKAETIY